ncbi:membrane protein [Actinorhabdospora filicis]|uniref:Membrane protein n=1 Tax=Actinorhabdospora filicis TaxID=1785913 RepID=A0A9W6SKP7_9ACTN|nr:PP2C family protein-serine/threonine phosphatase [Actinorhabdospora filicis]GLZ78018.1 membrane protein [Actinorhabdospora filicis]
MVAVHILDRPGIRLAGARALPALLFAGSIAAYLVSMDRYDRFLFAVPALAAVTWRATATTLFGVAAMAASAVLAARREEDFLSVTLVNEIALATVTAVATWAARLRETREQDLRQVRAVAETVQHIVLQPLPGHLGAVDLHLLCDAATAHAHVGGDFYEALRVGGGVRVMIGDVQGHGLPSVEMAGILVGAFREHAYTAACLRELAERLEVSVDRYVARAADAEAADRFATVLLAEIPDREPVVRLVSLGHPPPLIQRGPDTVPVAFARHSPPLNLAGLCTCEPRVEEAAFGPGDRLLLFTDGLTEARDRAGTFYPLEERLRALHAEPAGDLLPGLRRELRAHTGGGRCDDMAAVLVVREPVPRV